MKKLDISKKASESSGEYVFGSADTGSHACYVIYGILGPGEKDRFLKPGRGHEEIILSVKGTIEVRGDFSGRLLPGEAFHIAGEHSCTLENSGEDEAVYVISGGHSEAGHHH